MQKLPDATHPAVRAFRKQWDKLSDADKADPLNLFPYQLQLLALPILASLPDDLHYDSFDEEAGTEWEELEALIEQHPKVSDLPNLRGEQLEGMSFDIHTVRSTVGRIGVLITTNDGYSGSYSTLILAIDKL